MKAFDFGSIDEIDIWTKDSPPPETAAVYVSQEVNLAAVVAITDLLCPRFVDVEGAVLLETSADPTGFQTWREYFNGDLRAVEAQFPDRAFVCEVTDEYGPTVTITNAVP